MIKTTEELLLKVLMKGYPLRFEKNDFFRSIPVLLEAKVIKATQHCYINGMVILELEPVTIHTVCVTDDNHSLPMALLSMNRRNNYEDTGLFQLNVSGGFFDTIEYLRKNVPTPFNNNIQQKRVIALDQI